MRTQEQIANDKNTIRTFLKKTPYTKNEIAEATGVKAVFVGVHLSELAGQGYAKKIGDKRGAKWAEV